jgi:pimeloyl-ACP methyl ester carboxylesterase
MDQFLRGAAIAGAGLAALAACYEWRGRRLRRRDSAIVPSCEDSRIALCNRRVLGYRELGVPDGEPVFYFHGALGSRLEWPADPCSPARAGVRLIAIDRPGYGCSDPAPGLTLRQSVDDIRALADALGIDRFRIIAWSAGSVYAMACAVVMPERITRLDLVGAVVPESYPEGHKERDPRLAFFARFAQWAPGTAYALLRRTIARREADPEWFECELERNLSLAERAVLADPAIRDLTKRSHAAGEARLGAGIIGDLEVGGGKWFFTPADVRVPVVMWQGAVDRLTPESRNSRLLREFPDVQLRRFSDEGHFLLYRHEDEILYGPRRSIVDS